MSTATETDYYAGIVEAARLGGWMICHFRPARTAHGWRTPLQGDSGYPDFTLIHPEAPHVIFVEVKADGQKLRPDQQAWRTALEDAGADYRLIHTSQVPEFRQWLVDVGLGT